MNQNQSENVNQNWERQALEHLLLENLKETRKARRWRAVFRILTLFIFIGVVLAVFDFNLPGRGMGTEKHTALVTIEGEISSSSLANALDINSSLTSAFENESSVGVVLRINSPGGSPVQAGMMNDEIQRLRKLYPAKPLYVVVEDICASGGYYVAVAGDQILVDKASLVGSIGVIMEGFGFTGLMDKLGVTRRMITAGSNKGMMDPFSKENPQQVEMIKTMIDEIHQQFIAVVKAGRGDRLKETPEMFSGRVWNGEQAIKIGLVDGYGTVETVARDIFKAPDILDYTMKENFAERVAKRFGAEVGAAAGKALIKTPDLK
jgi:protease-4